jgi:hypothetical protein
MTSHVAYSPVADKLFSAPPSRMKRLARSTPAAVRIARMAHLLAMTTIGATLSWRLRGELFTIAQSGPGAASRTSVTGWPA